MLPKKVFFTKGVGRHKEKLASFEVALRNAGIAAYNIVNVSSILPPGCKIISKEKAIKQLYPGQILFVVLARNATNEPNRLIASSIGTAIPAAPKAHGYLSEHHSFGQSDTIAGDYAEDLAARMLASTLDIEFDEDQSYDELKELWQIDGRIYKTSNVTQSAVGKEGLWTTTVAAAVLYDNVKIGSNEDSQNPNNELPNGKSNINILTTPNATNVYQPTIGKKTNARKI